MKSNELAKLMDNFRDILLRKTAFNTPQIETIIGLLRIEIINLSTPEEPPTTRPATAESFTSVEEPPKSYKEAFNKSERKAIEKLRQESDAFDKLVIEEMSKTSANEKQVGGKHYKIAIEPWDFILANNLGFLEGNAIKYIVRHKQKNGIQDISKAIHYLEKLKEHELERLERETK